MKNKKTIIVLLILLVIVAAGVIYSCSSKNNAAEVIAEPTETESVSETAAEENAAPESDTFIEICVHVCGCVVNPGVYYLSEGSRIYDAVTKAGGMTETAAESFINMAAYLEDGQQVYIPDINETNGMSPMTDKVSDGLVNINTATKEELKTLPGIGDTKADAIILYRENVGAFKSIEDIKNVAGIKDSAYDKIKDYIKV